MGNSLIIEAKQTKEPKNITLPGAKNAALPILASCIIIPCPIKLFNMPKSGDVITMINLLDVLGAKMSWNKTSLSINCSNIEKINHSNNLVQKLRASFLMFGPLLIRKGMSQITKPGGCCIGERKLDIHLDGLKRFGAEITERDMIKGTLKKPKAIRYMLKYPSVGATQHLISVASAINEISILKGCATEPEVLDLISFLKKAGADIRINKRTVIIKGTKSFSKTEHTLIPDRIIAATWILGAVITRKRIKIESTAIHYLDSLFLVLSSIGVEIKKTKKEVLINPKTELKPFHVITGPYPSFPTDLQPFMAVLACTINGKSIIEETVFEQRFDYAKELKKLGADIEVCGKMIAVHGGKQLYGTTISGNDLRGTAALGLAALIAKGKTRINNKNHLDRGYRNFRNILESFGARVTEI